MRALLTVLASAVALSLHAFVDPIDASSQYKPYPVDSITELTPAPQGYRPVHMEHYGRHGSRWLIEDKNYDIPVAQLEKAESAGKLTPLGTRLLAELRQIRDDSKGRLGELTPLGAEQHRGIARRMTEHFPELFVPGTPVDARSTVVIRCILSMLNEIETLAAISPQLAFTTDASERHMWYMNHHDPEKNAATDSIKDIYIPVVDKAFANNGDYLKRLISDPTFARDSIDSDALFTQLFEVALNIPSHGDAYRPFLTDVFTPEEIDRGWRRNNVNWFFNGANTALNHNLSPTVQRHLLRNMIASADTALVSGRPSVNLRFGHETMVLSLAVLLELDDYGAEHNDPLTLSDSWQAYRIFPMACNIQILFYQPDGAQPSPDNTLVKVLLNEREMPVSFLTPVSGPYYRWPELRDTLLAKLASRP